MQLGISIQLFQSKLLYLTLCFSSMISFVLLTYHIWNNRAAQYAMPTDIFMTLNFETYNLGINHILNRRIRDRTSSKIPLN